MRRFLGVSVMCCTLFAGLALQASATIYQWEWDPSLGVIESTTPCLDGVGVSAAPNAYLYSLDLTHAYLINANLSSANLMSTTLTSANLSKANLSHANLWYGTLTDANLSNANLADASLNNSTLTGANLHGADLRRACYSNLDGAILHNTVLSDGTINVLSLAAGEMLLVHNNLILASMGRDGSISLIAPSIPIHIAGTPSFAPTSSLQMIFDGNPWGSIISFDPGVSIALAGDLDLSFAPGVAASDLVGDTFQLFDWTGTSRTGEFNVVSDLGCVWDLSQLYATGQVTLISVPEPSGIALMGIGIVGLCGCLWRRRRMARRAVA